MKRSAAFIVAALFLLINLSGCLAPIIIGGAVGALGGYAISKDTVQADSDTPYENLWNSAQEVAKMRGVIEQEDGIRGYLSAQIEASIVEIRLVRLTHATTRVRVKARRYHFPNLSLAEDLFVRIMENTK